MNKKIIIIEFSTNHAPPESVCVGTKLFRIFFFLRKVDKKGGEYETKESYVERCEQLLHRNSIGQQIKRLRKPNLQSSNFNYCHLALQAFIFQFFTVQT